MSAVGQHQQAALTAPVAGGALAAAIVRGNDNSIATAHNAHDADATIHPQSSTLAGRPAFGIADRLWVTTDTLQWWRDTGTAWVVLNGGSGVTSLATQIKSSSYAMATTDGLVIISGASTVTLPPQMPVGSEVTVFRNDPTAADVQVVVASGDNFDANAGTSTNTYHLGRNKESLRARVIATVGSPITASTWEYFTGSETVISATTGSIPGSLAIIGTQLLVFGSRSIKWVGIWTNANLSAGSLQASLQLNGSTITGPGTTITSGQNFAVSRYDPGTYQTAQSQQPAALQLVLTPSSSPAGPTLITIAVGLW